MIIWPRTLSAQLTWATLLAVFITQALMTIGLLFLTESKLDEFEQRYLFKKIVSTFQRIQDRPENERGTILELASGEEVGFAITYEPEGSYGTPQSYHTNVLAGMLPDTIFYVDQREATLWNTIQFWTNQIDDSCFFSDLMQPNRHGCPHWTVSLDLGDGAWLRVRTLPGPPVGVIIAPVFVSAFLSLIVIAIVVIVMARRITSPLLQLSQFAERLGRGETTLPLAPSGPQEISLTTDAFNLMQKRLKRYVDDRTEMLAAISHDLRTPITSLRLRVEFVKDNELRNNMINTIEEMQTMVASCLNFARNEAENELMSPVNLIELMKALAGERIEASFDTQLDELIYNCRPVNLKRALRNLSENAIKYGSIAEYELRNNEDQINILIWDNGAGIPKADLERVFSPFIRLDTSRNVSDGNVGLGLAIARGVIRKHGGDITPVVERGRFGMQVSLPS